MRVWINTDDTNWGRDGAIFDDYAEAERIAVVNATQWVTEDHSCTAEELLDTLDEIEIEDADAGEIEDIEREIKMLGYLSPATMAAIAARKLRLILERCH